MAKKENGKIPELSSEDFLGKEEYEGYLKEKVDCQMKDLRCPPELKNMKYAEEAWDYVIKLNSESSVQLLNERHTEAIKSYCIAVAMRKQMMDAWKNLNIPIVIMENNVSKIHPLIKEVKALNSQINSLANDLGLTVLGELKMLKTSQNTKVPTGTKNNKKGMFD